MINDPEDQGEDDVGDDDANKSEKQKYSVKILYVCNPILALLSKFLNIQNT